VAIKVNLLPREAQPARSRRAISVPKLSLGGALVTQILTGILLLTVLVLAVTGYRAWSAAGEHRAQITQLRAQNEQLKTQLSALRAAEEAKREIQRRIEVIGKVAKSQGVPLAMLTGVLRAVPQGVWLNNVEMKPQEVRVRVQEQAAGAGSASETLARLEAKREEATGGAAAQGGQKPGGATREVTELAGYSVLIRGVAFNNFQVADFMQNLRRNGLFSNIDFVVTQAERVEQTRVMSFEVTASVKL
jgi:Tfp pilus assembly protein PilN